MFDVLRWLTLPLLTALLVACGSAPTVSASKTLQAPAQRVQALRLVYHKASMKTVSTTSYNPRGQPITVASTGIDGFGLLLTRQAPAAFAAVQVQVPQASVIDGELLPLHLLATMQKAPQDGGPRHLLLIAPQSARVQATSASTLVSYVFAATLIDLHTRQTLWQAQIDTKTWKGTDFVMRNFEGPTYNEDYARDLLQALLRQMQADGLI
jgi:hypothetical protein